MIRIRDCDECCVGIYRTRGVTDSSNLVFFVTPNIPISMRSYMRLCSTEKTPSPKRPYARCGIQRCPGAQAMALRCWIPTIH